VIGLTYSCGSDRGSSRDAYESNLLATAAVEAGLMAGQAYLSEHCDKGTFFRELVSTEANPKPLPIAVPSEAPWHLRQKGASLRVLVLGNADGRLDPTADADRTVRLLVTGIGPLGDEKTFEARIEATRCPGEVVVRSLRPRL
jgi:hypothetical protein